MPLPRLLEMVGDASRSSTAFLEVLGKFAVQQTLSFHPKPKCQGFADQIVRETVALGLPLE